MVNKQFSLSKLIINDKGPLATICMQVLNDKIAHTLVGNVEKSGIGYSTVR